MLTIVFGAGASFDAIPNASEDQRLPLVQEIFSDRDTFRAAAAKYSKSLPLVARLAALVQADSEVNLETELAHIAVAANGNPEQSRQLAALRFYLSEVIDQTEVALNAVHHGITNYVTLLEQVGQWRHDRGERVRLVTFNYDTLLDRALEDQVGNLSLIGPSSLDSYVNRDDWQLIKLHGSTSWARIVKCPALGGMSPDYTQSVMRAAELDFTSSHVVGKLPRNLTDELYFPAIAVPTDTKSTFECPSSHEAAFRQALAETNRLLVIGWKAGEPNVLELLRHVPIHAQITVVDKGENADDVMNRIAEAFGAVVNPVVHRNGFSKFTRFELESWLADT